MSIRGGGPVYTRLADKVSKNSKKAVQEGYKVTLCNYMVLRQKVLLKVVRVRVLGLLGRLLGKIVVNKSQDRKYRVCLRGHITGIEGA